MGADCKSVAKASKVRILHLPPRANEGPDQRKRRSGPFALCPSWVGGGRGATAVLGVFQARFLQCFRAECFGDAAARLLLLPFDGGCLLCTAVWCAGAGAFCVPRSGVRVRVPSVYRGLVCGYGCGCPLCIAVWCAGTGAGALCVPRSGVRVVRECSPVTVVPTPRYWCVPSGWACRGIRPLQRAQVRPLPWLRQKHALPPRTRAGACASGPNACFYCRGRFLRPAAGWSDERISGA